MSKYSEQRVSRDKWEAQEKELCLCEQQLADARAREGRLRKDIGEVEAHLLDADRHDDPKTLRGLCRRQANYIRFHILATPAPKPGKDSEGKE